MKHARRSCSNSSSSPYASSSSSGSSSLNSSTVESFQFSPWNNGCMPPSVAHELFPKSVHALPLFSPVSPSQLHGQAHASDDEQVDSREYVYSSDEDSNSFHVDPHATRNWHRGLAATAGEVSDAESSTRKPKQTLAELMNSADHDELQSLLNSVPIDRPSSSPHRKSTSKPPSKSLLIQALCGGRRSTSVTMLNPDGKNSSRPPPPQPFFKPGSPPRLQRSRSKCTAPSPLRNSNCCSSGHIVDCTVVVRSKSSGIRSSRAAASPDNFLTKSKSLGAAPHVVHSGKILRQPQQPVSKGLQPVHYSNSNHPSYEKCSSRSTSRRSACASSVHSSSNDSIMTAMERYQKNSKAEQKRRSSYLPYKSVLLSFFPFSSLWRGGQHQHHQRSTAAY